MNKDVSIYEIMPKSYLLPYTEDEFKKRVSIDLERVLQIYESFLLSYFKKTEEFISINPKKLKSYKRCRRRKVCLPLLNEFVALWDKDQEFFLLHVTKLKRILSDYKVEKEKRKKLLDDIFAYYIYEMISYTKKIQVDEDESRKCARYKSIRKITLCGIKVIKQRIRELKDQVNFKIEELEDKKLEHEILLERYLD